METNEILFNHTVTDFNQIKYVGSDRAKKEAWNNVMLVLDLENCKRIVESTPHLSYDDVRHANK